MRTLIALSAVAMLTLSAGDAIGCVVAHHHYAVERRRERAYGRHHY